MFNYPYQNTEELNLDWFLKRFDELLVEWTTANANIAGSLQDEIDRVETAITDLITAKDQAVAAATAASNSAVNASNSEAAARAAENIAVLASTQANSYRAAAETSASNAAISESAAANSATGAATSATQAANSATAAGTSETNARNSADDAEDSATAAATSAAAAAASAASSDGSAAQAMIASAESSSTAAYAHSTGDYFRLSGVLYKATADIAVGDTITAGTNCVVAVLGDDVSDLNDSLDDLSEAFDEQTDAVDAIENTVNSLVDVFATSIENTTPTFFETITESNIIKAEAEIEYTQSGSGTPSPTNPMPLAGHVSCTLYFSEDGTTGTGKSYTASWGTAHGAIYGGTIDLVSGEIEITHLLLLIDGTNASSEFTYNTAAQTGGSCGRIAWNPYASIGSGNSFVSDKLNAIGVSGAPNEWEISGHAQLPRMFIGIPNTITSVAQFLTYCQSEPISVVYKLATPQIVKIDHQTITSLVGDNYVFASTGDMVSLQYVSSKINDLIDDVNYRILLPQVANTKQATVTSAGIEMASALRLLSGFIPISYKTYFKINLNAVAEETYSLFALFYSNNLSTTPQNERTAFVSGDNVFIFNTNESNKYVRFCIRNSAGTEIQPNDVEIIIKENPIIDIKSHNYYPTICNETFEFVQSRIYAQDIAVYDGNIFDFHPGYVSINGGTGISITNGHGNNCCFGETLHGDYPYLYCADWTSNECKIYVNQYDSGSFTLVRTIDFSSVLSGYLNACVDEANDKIYILLVDDPYAGVINFVIADLTSGNVLSQTTLTAKIPVIEGMTFYDGHIYVASGHSASYPNYLTVINTSGNIVSKTSFVDIPWNVQSFDALEGFDIDKATGIMYVGTTKFIMSNEAN